MQQTRFLIIDEPLPLVRRVTLNRPEKRNALCNPLRAELFAALEAADQDPSIRVIILRGAGKDFCAGYDLQSDVEADLPYHTAGGLGQWPRHVVEGAFRIWDLAKPVIAQVHGHCLAGGTELATACDIVYAAEDAKIGYPILRIVSPPDAQVFPWIVGMRHALEMMLTGDAISGVEAAQWGFATRAFPAEKLEEATLGIAERVSRIPTEVQQFNKRSVHRAMEIMGMRSALRAGTEIQALASQTESAKAFFAKAKENLTKALTERDAQFGDYRTKDTKKPGG
jgi:enoyl-CoA hydratase